MYQILLIQTIPKADRGKSLLPCEGDNVSSLLNCQVLEILWMMDGDISHKYCLWRYYNATSTLKMDFASTKLHRGNGSRERKGFLVFFQSSCPLLSSSNAGNSFPIATRAAECLAAFFEEHKSPTKEPVKCLESTVDWNILQLARFSPFSISLTSVVKRISGSDRFSFVWQSW